jgi:hypothetical protein
MRSLVGLERGGTAASRCSSGQAECRRLFASIERRNYASQAYGAAALKHLLQVPTGVCARARRAQPCRCAPSSLAEQPGVKHPRPSPQQQQQQSQGGRAPANASDGGPLIALEACSDASPCWLCRVAGWRRLRPAVSRARGRAAAASLVCLHAVTVS